MKTAKKIASVAGICQGIAASLSGIALGVDPILIVAVVLTTSLFVAHFVYQMFKFAK